MRPLTMHRNEIDSPHEQLLVEMDNDILVEGDLLDIAGSAIYLGNIVNCHNNNKTDDVLFFDRAEIQSISILPDKSSGKLLSMWNNTKNDTKDKETDSARLQTIAISNELFRHYREMMFNYVLLTDTNEKYFQAIGELLHSEAIGVVGLGNEFDRSGRLSLVVLATVKQVYIFDIFRNRGSNFFSQIRTVLESSSVTKIMHGPELYGHLYDKRNVKMKNVFDTQIADLKISKPDSKRNISECLSYYFKFPKTLLQHAVEQQMHTKQWFNRPLDHDQFVVAAQLAVYLWKLRDHLQKLMLQPLYQAITDDYFNDKSDVTANNSVDSVNTSFI